MAGKMNLRKARIKDINAIDSLYTSGTFDEEKFQNKNLKKEKWGKIMQKHEKQRQANMKKELINKKQYWVVVEINKEIVGFGQVVIINKSQAELEKLYVSKNYRKKGVASIIEKSAEDWLKKKKIGRIYSRILIDNRPSIQFHKNLGFKQTAIRMDKIVK